jgi:AFG3 family protein
VYVYFRFGRPGGKEGGEREKWIIIGLVGTVALLGTLAYYEMGYKEIAWKEFVNK